MSMMDPLEENTSSTAPLLPQKPQPLFTVDTDALFARLGGGGEDTGRAQALFARLASKVVQFALDAAEKQLSKGAAAAAEQLGKGADKDATDTGAAPPDKDAVDTEAAPILGGGDDTDAEEARAPRDLVLKPALAWIDLFLQCAYAGLLLGLYYGGGDCPAIPLSSVYIIGTSACVVGGGAVRFLFGHGDDEAIHPGAAAAMALLAAATFGFFVLGLVIVPVNLDIYCDPGPDTCDLAPLIALAIPLAVPVLMCWCCLSSTCCAMYLLCHGAFAAAEAAAEVEEVVVEAEADVADAVTDVRSKMIEAEAGVAQAEADVAQAEADVRSKMTTAAREAGEALA